MSEEQNVRNERGQFVAGAWQGGPGRPARETDLRILENQRSLHEMLCGEIFPEERMRKIFNKLGDKAEAGDVRAIALVMSYVVGKPQDLGDDNGATRLIVRIEQPGEAAPLPAEDDPQSITLTVSRFEGLPAPAEDAVDGH